MKEALRYIFRFLLVLAAIVAGFFLHVANPELSLMEDDFAVDSQGYIYVGDTDDMIVYDPNGKTVRHIPLSTQKCSFTIVSDIIIRDIGYEFRFYDLFGNHIYTMERESDEFEELPLHIKYFNSFNSGNEFESEDGTKYVKKSLFGRKIIYRINEEKYIPVVKMPMRDYYVKIGYISLFLLLAVCNFSFLKDICPEEFEKINIINKGKNLYTK